MKSGTQKTQKNAEIAEGARMVGAASEEGLRELSGKIIGAAIEVQRHLGSGLLEHAYEACLVHELNLQGLKTMRQVGLDLSYKGLEVPNAYRMDLVVEGLIVLELKAVPLILPEHEAQVLSYLRFSGLPLALILNFRAFPLGEKGIKRLAMSHPYSLPPSSSSSSSSSSASSA